MRLNKIYLHAMPTKISLTVLGISKTIIWHAKAWVSIDLEDRGQNKILFFFIPFEHDQKENPNYKPWFYIFLEEIRNPNKVVGKKRKEQIFSNLIINRLKKNILLLLQKYCWIKDFIQYLHFFRELRIFSRHQISLYQDNRKAKAEQHQPLHCFHDSEWRLCPHHPIFWTWLSQLCAFASKPSITLMLPSLWTKLLLSSICKDNKYI